MPKFKVGLAQINPTLGDLAANLQKHGDYISRAKKAGLDLLVFPELSLTGYFLQDLNATVALSREDKKILGPLKEASRDLDLVVGFVEEDERHQFYISTAYLAGGKIKHLHRKVYLPTYGMFSDGRFFSPGDSFSTFPTKLGKAGILICEDGWHLSSAYLLWMDGADFLLHVNASPGYGVAPGGEVRAQAHILRLGRVYAEFLTSFVLFCNRVGTEDGATFWGGSMIVSPGGEVIAQGPFLEEGLVQGEVDTAELRRVRSRLPLLRDEKLEMALRELTRISWQDRWPKPRQKKDGKPKRKTGRRS